MINDLSLLLKKILDDSHLPEPLQSAQIAFDRPTESYKPEQTTVNLFLYDIRENVELRSNEQSIERQNGLAIIRRAPLRVACSYLVTAWPVGLTGEALALQEHQLLSQVLQTLSGYPTIPTIFLEGTNLANQELPLPMITAAAEGLKNSSEFWASLGNRLRPSLTVTVTLAMEVFPPETPPPRLVITEKVRFAQQGLPATKKVFFRIGGRVTTRVHSGTAQGGAGGPLPTITLASSASATNDFYNGMQIEITGGAGSDQVRTVIEYVGATRVATVNSNWATVPNNTSTYDVNAPVAGATVTLVGTVFVTRTSADGNYTLGPISPPDDKDEIPFTLTLQVQTSKTTKDVIVTIPAPAGSNYNVQL